ncbi:uncharacterized protein [Amphiura filiformis]|uniref:uncharacterized protein isoform X2 n=1 Tax=Amphiura filiformis TaxID=82378 RepID=UPI003B226D85
MASKGQRACNSDALINKATYECSNKDKPLKRHWYVDTADYGPDYGDWFLSRKNGNWVLQRAADGKLPAESQFLVYTFTTSTPSQGLAIMQIQADSYKEAAKDCLAASEETYASQLDILDLPNNLITDRIGANCRLFEAVGGLSKKPVNKEEPQTEILLLEGMNTFESIYHRGESFCSFKSYTRMVQK